MEGVGTPESSKERGFPPQESGKPARWWLKKRSDMTTFAFSQISWEAGDFN